MLHSQVRQCFVVSKIMYKSSWSMYVYDAYTTQVIVFFSLGFTFYDFHV